MVMTLVSLAVQSARTYVFVCSDTVCFEIRGSVYQRGPRNFRSRERHVQREPTTEVILILTSKRTEPCGKYLSCSDVHIVEEYKKEQIFGIYASIYTVYVTLYQGGMCVASSVCHI